MLKAQGEGESEELVLKPAGASHIRTIGTAFLLMCEVNYAKYDVEYNIQWFSGEDQEITDVIGNRFVCLVVLLLTCSVQFTCSSRLCMTIELADCHFLLFG